jgi:streptogramin lyase
MRVPQSALILASICLAAAVLIAGSKQVTIKEFDVPTSKSRPHDPAVGRDGSLWYTGQAANKLGRLDPATGKFKEFPLKTPGSGPHGLLRTRKATFGSPRSPRDTLAN